MAIHEVNAVLELTELQEELMERIIKLLAHRGEWTPEKILSFAVSGLMGDLTEELLTRFERIVELGEKGGQTSPPGI